jgi:hypothetical protein
MNLVFRPNIKYDSCQQNKLEENIINLLNSTTKIQNYP